MQEWAEQVKAARSASDALMFHLGEQGASIMPDEEQNAHDAASIHYIAQFRYPDQVVVTVFLMTMDHQTQSPVVIENMTTKPDNKRGQGFGRRTIAAIRTWAAECGVTEIRATQVDPSNVGFWEKCGFRQAQDENRCNDFVWP